MSKYTQMFWSDSEIGAYSMRVKYVTRPDLYRVGKLQEVTTTEGTRKWLFEVETRDNTEDDLFASILGTTVPFPFPEDGGDSGANHA